MLRGVRGSGGWTSYFWTREASNIKQNKNKKVNKRMTGVDEDFLRWVAKANVGGAVTATEL